MAAGAPGAPGAPAVGARQRLEEHDEVERGSVRGAALPGGTAGGRSAARAAGRVLLERAASVTRVTPLISRSRDISRATSSWRLGATLELEGGRGDVAAQRARVAAAADASAGPVTLTPGATVPSSDCSEVSAGTTLREVGQGSVPVEPRRRRSADGLDPGLCKLRELGVVGQARGRRLRLREPAAGGWRASPCAARSCCSSAHRRVTKASAMPSSASTAYAGPVRQRGAASSAARGVRRDQVDGLHAATSSIVRPAATASRAGVEAAEPARPSLGDEPPARAAARSPDQADRRSRGSRSRDR